MTQAPADTSLSLPVTATLNLRQVQAAADAERVLACLSPPVAKLSCLRQICRDQLDMDMTSPGWPARLLGWLAQTRTGPFTWTMIRLTGKPPVIETIPGSERERRATGPEAAVLGAGWIWERAGRLVLGGTAAAEVSLRLRPDLLGSDEMARIAKGEPCGQVIPGLARTARTGQACWPGDPAVRSAATLTRPSAGPFGFAGELVTAAACARLGA